MTSKEKENMKKNLLKSGALVLALVLAMVFAACEQPTDEGEGGAGSPTLIRLYLDRDDATIEPGDSLVIRVGEDLLIPTGPGTNYPYPHTEYPAGSGTIENSIKPDTTDRRESGVTISDKDANKVLAIPGTLPAAMGTATTAGTPARGTATVSGGPTPPAGEITGITSVIKSIDPKKKFLTTGTVEAKAPVATDAQVAGNSIQVDPRGIYYIDLELVNQTPTAKDRGSVFSGSISGYVELMVVRAAAAPSINLMPNTAYMYTKDKHGFNDLWKMGGTTAYWKTNNANIKKVSLKSGVNELYLSYFSHGQAAN
jgi:hypothetical protein